MPVTKNTVTSKNNKGGNAGKNVKANTKTKKNTKLNNEKKYKYYAESEFVPEKYLQQQFSARGNWTRVPSYKLKATHSIDYIYVDGKCLLDKVHYGVDTHLKNIIDEKKKLVCDKHLLVENMNKSPTCKKYVNDSKLLDLLDISIDLLDISNNKPTSVFIETHKPLFANPAVVYIFKPISGFGGAGIQRFNTFDDFLKSVKSIITKYSPTWKPTIKHNRNNRYWQLQQYMTDPLLLNLNDEKYKFHVRMYFIYRPGDKQSFYLKRGLIATALAPYYKGNWTDTDIHDTHFNGRVGESFPVALGLSQANSSNIYRQLDELFGEINKILKSNNAGCFSESSVCYHLFGADIMITQDYQVKILELNCSPGLYTPEKDKLIPEANSVIENIMDIIVDEYFPPQHKPDNPYRDDVVFLN